MIRSWGTGSAVQAAQGEGDLQGEQAARLGGGPAADLGNPAEPVTQVFGCTKRARAAPSSEPPAST